MSQETIRSCFSSAIREAFHIRNFGRAPLPSFLACITCAFSLYAVPALGFLLHVNANLRISRPFTTPDVHCMMDVESMHAARSCTTSDRHVTTVRIYLTGLATATWESLPRLWVKEGPFSRPKWRMMVLPSTPLHVQSTVTQCIVIMHVSCLPTTERCTLKLRN